MMKTILLLFIFGIATKSCNETKTIYVADHLSDCTGVAKQKCMLVREHPTEEWHYFYDHIEGFTYKEGYTYQLKVAIEKVKDPAADASSLKYTLIEIISKEESHIKKPVSIYNKWKVISLEGMEELVLNPVIEFNSEEKRISGFAGCNNFFGNYDDKRKELSFSKMGMTRKMCPDMSLENNFINHLRNANTLDIEGENLMFYDKDFKLIITCELIK